MGEFIRLTQLDGKLPNLALMRLANYHRDRGDRIVFSRKATPDMFEPGRYDRVYGSSIFSFSARKRQRFLAAFPNAVLGGTGTASPITIEQTVGGVPNRHDYSIYPDFRYSIGFLQRGCRLKCKFCVVPEKEGRPRQEMSVSQLWRGSPHSKKLHILDNDFFGVSGWQQHVEDIVSGGFKICLNQGINVRLINDDAAAALATMQYLDDGFRRRRIYTAWDNLGDEKVFFRGIDLLEKHGIPPSHVMAYMLIGYDPKETLARIMHRFQRMVERGILPYPMVYDSSRRDLKRFQRWVVTGLYRAIPFSDYRAGARKSPERGGQGSLELNDQIAVAAT